MRSISLPVVFTVSFILSLIQSYGQGLVFNDEAYGQFQRTKFNQGSKSTLEALANHHKIDLKPYCPEVKHQGTSGSCVGWALGYAAMSMENAIHNNWKDQTDSINESAFSAMFLYNQIKINDCDFGAELDKAFKFLSVNGNVKETEFNIGSTNCDSLPSEKLMAKAKLNRVEKFATLFGPDAEDQVKIQNTKLSLIDKKPVVIGIMVRENFLDLKSNHQYWYPLIGRTNIFGGHAMVVVGYDDGKKAFEVMNSWGETWGNGGFAWIKYKDYAEYCKYAYQFSLEGDPESAFLEGQIKILCPTVKSFQNNTILFSEVSFSLKNGVYRLKKHRQPLPFEFQVGVERLAGNSYLYAVSFDKDLNPSIHWPREPQTEGSLLPITDEFRIPGRYQLLSIKDKGTEYLCFLNSKKPIPDFGKKVESIKTTKGNFQTKVHTIFQTQLASDVIYDREQLSYFSSVTSDQIVPIILELELK